MKMSSYSYPAMIPCIIFTLCKCAMIIDVSSVIIITVKGKIRSQWEEKGLWPEILYNLTMRKKDLPEAGHELVIFKHVVGKWIDCLDDVSDGYSGMKGVEAHQSSPFNLFVPFFSYSRISQASQSY